MMREERRTNPETGETVDVVVPKYSMDSLRHTYAVMTYHNHMKAGFSEFEAWRYISAVLGHKSTATTIVTYGDYLSIWPIVPGWQG